MLKLETIKNTSACIIDNDLHLQGSDVLKKYLVYLQSTEKVVRNILNNRNKSLTQKQIQDGRIEAERCYHQFVD